MIHKEYIVNEGARFNNMLYPENVSPEVIDALRRNVFVIYGNIICYKEVLTPSPFTVNVLFDEFERIAREFPSYAMLLDVSNSKRPDAKLRLTIDRRFNELPGNIFHCACFTGKNPIINTAIRFIMFGSGRKSFSISSTREQAINKIENARR